VGTAVVAFVAGAGWAGAQIVGGGLGAPAPARSASETGPDPGTGEEPALDAGGTGRAFLAAWQAGRYDAMQDLVADPQDDMTRVYGGLAKRLGIRRGVVTPGTLAADGSSLSFRAVMTSARRRVARGYPWAASAPRRAGRPLPFAGAQASLNP